METKENRHESALSTRALKRSPVLLRRKDNLVRVEHRDTGDSLAWCFIGDELNSERIADLLSMKGCPLAANELRAMVAADRKAANRPPPPKAKLIDRIGAAFK